MKTLVIGGTGMVGSMVVDHSYGCAMQVSMIMFSLLGGANDAN
jgi:hypothetical protein